VLVIPIFGLSVFAVRFPSALFGVLGVLFTFFLIKELFKNNKYSDLLALSCSLLLAISPWDIQFSRVGFEAHVGVILNLLVVLFFIKSFKKPWFLLLVAFFAGLNIYEYQSEKVFTPLLLLVLFLVYLKDFIKVPKKYILSSIILGLVIILPMLSYIVSNKQALLRIQGTSVFSDQTQVLQNSIPRLEADKLNGDKLGLILDNRRIVYGRTIVAGYLSHFDLNWLFIQGDLIRHHAPNMGLLYLFEFPFLFLGIYFLIFGEFDKKTKLIIFAWFLITPIPASITSGVPHAVRTMNFLPVWQIFISVGIVYSFINLSKYKNTSKIIYSLVIIFAAFNFIYFLNQYFVQQNYFTAKDWQYGWERTVSYVSKIAPNYKKIIVSDSQPLDRSYMFFAFYLKYPPLEYQKYGRLESGGFAEAHAFGNYEFRPLDFAKDSKNSNTLLIGLPSEFPSSVTPLKMIYYPDGTPDIEIVSK
jgi:4-amino-4-deoxy-L-arabinose transferase-like glycosyltransferase